MADESQTKHCMCQINEHRAALLHVYLMPCTGVDRKLPSHIHILAGPCIDIKTCRKSKNCNNHAADLQSLGQQASNTLWSCGKRSCDCPDHITRKHVCKHMCFVYKYLDTFKVHQRRHWHQVNMFTDARLEDLISLCSCFGSVMLQKSRLPVDHCIKTYPTDSPNDKACCLCYVLAR